MSWKKTYLHTSQIHRKYDRGRDLCRGSCPLIALNLLSLSPPCPATRYSPHGWILDETSFFVVIDASIQRFKDLMEVRPCHTLKNPSDAPLMLLLLLLLLPTRSVTVSTSLPAGRTASRGRCPSLVAARAPNSAATCWRSKEIYSGACKGCVPWTRASWTLRTRDGALSSTRRSRTRYSAARSHVLFSSK